MNGLALCLAIVALLFGWVGQVQGVTIIHESATMVAVEQLGGFVLAEGQFLGSRFSVSTAVTVQQIGGHIGGFDFGNLFGTIVSLSSPSALPSSDPFDGTTFASTTFTAALPSADIRTPLDATLAAGDYALIFGGSGQSGATVGFMPRFNMDLLGASYFFWNGFAWTDGAISGTRFVVEGTVETVVPEPSTLLLLGTAVLGLLGYARRRMSGAGVE